MTLFMIKGHTLKRDDDAKLQEEGKKWVETNKKHGLFHSKATETSTATDNTTSA